jgi:hypothetical protein
VTTTRSIRVPLVRVWSEPEGGRLRRTLAWGDRVEYVGRAGGNLVVETVSYEELPDGSVRSTAVRGHIRHDGRRTDEILGPERHAVLAVEFVDVQQGDAAVVESPDGAVMLIDGGENQLFARYLANRYRGTTATKPKVIDTIVVTHGDADHFAGLRQIYDSERDSRTQKRLFIRPRRVFHNGLAKGPSDLRDIEMFGTTAEVNDRRYIVGLVDDLRSVRDSKLNKPFKAWKAALVTYGRRAQDVGETMTIERLERGRPARFPTFAAEGIAIDILAPITTPVPTPAGPKPGLPFLSRPRAAMAPPAPGPGSPSASHTVNGHSIVMRLTYGRCRFLFTGDLNREAEELMIEADAAGTSSLESDVLKVPHHGSADFSPSFLRAVGALVSVVSSGDESARKEYIHPRATLVGALGRHSRADDPLIFVTELVAFFAVEGYVGPEFHEMTADGTTALSRGVPAVDIPDRKKFFSFSRSAFGTVHMRTDGRKLLVWTDSALVDLKEAYRIDLTKRPPRLESIVPI